MNLPIIGKIQDQARKAETRTREQLKELQERGRELVEKSSDNLRGHAERSRRTITRAEVQALDTVGAWIDRLNHATGDKADVLEKGREFLAEVARDIHLGNLTVDDLPIAAYDELGVKKIAAQLAELDLPQREMIRAYEALHKNRVSISRAIERLARIEANA